MIAVQDDELPTRRGGWWHEYVCPLHGTELLPPTGPDGYPCPHGCVLAGEPYDGAWSVFAHQAAARRLRLCAYQGRVDEALAILDHYVRLYADLAPGAHEGAASWMVPGRLFHQALTEAIWTTSVADAVWALASRTAPDTLAPVLRLLGALRETAVRARTSVAERNSNYIAWFNAADALVLGATSQVTGKPPPYDVVTCPRGLADHAAAAVLGDGWEWEGSTYYHQFVLRAYLLALKGRDLASLPAVFRETVLRMLDVLAQIATGSGMLPQLHDSPYDRPAQAMEYLELAVLARQFVGDDVLGPIGAAARRRLGESHDGLEDQLGGWFGGPPLSSQGGLGVGVCSGTVFGEVGYGVVWAPGKAWSAVVDFGGHGGAHGHRDKLALYLYGRSTGWQPDYGVTPYGSALRKEFYATTAAHPTFVVDGAEQRECAGRLIHWSESELCVETDTAYDGVVARRQLVMTPDYLLDVLTVECAEPRRVTLQFRPGVPLDVRTAGPEAFRTAWLGEEQLYGTHVGGSADVLVRPGMGPADDPVRPHTHVEWRQRGTRLLFASVFHTQHETVHLGVQADAVEVAWAEHRRSYRVRS